jgi:hypothetical protein
MRQALIIGARPTQTKGKKFPIVPLGEGTWRFQSEGLSESTVRIITGKETITLPHNALIKGPLTAQAVIEEAGAEPYINIFAELIK